MVVDLRVRSENSVVSVLKMGRENYVWSDNEYTESCFGVEFFWGKEKEKPLGPGDQWPRENYMFGSENK